MRGDCRKRAGQSQQLIDRHRRRLDRVFDGEHHVIGNFDNWLTKAKLRLLGGTSSGRSVWLGIYT